MSFGGPKPPPLPPPPPDPEVMADEAAKKAQAEDQKRRKGRVGRDQTVLTGTTDELGNVARKTLLGS